MRWTVMAGLRFILAYIVLSEHLEWCIGGSNPFAFLSKLDGLAAVLGFLLISGYSIANSITRNPQGFYQRRVFRIYPLYFCAVLYSSIPFLLTSKNLLFGTTEFAQPDSWTIAGNLLFLQGWGIESLSSNPVVWTLGVEVFCYMLAPLFAKASNKIILSLIGVSSLLFALFPYFYQPHYSKLQYGLALLLFLWAWLLGFFYFVNQEKTYSKILLVSLGCLLLSLNHVYTGKAAIVTYAISSMIIIYSPRINLSSNLTKILNYLGNISYPLYLFHLPTMFIIYSGLKINNPVVLILFSLLISMLFHHLVEVPLHSKKVALPVKIS